MTIDNLDPKDKRRLLKWAVVEHYRSWLSFDGIERRRIRTFGKLDGAAVRRISEEYTVNRRIASGKADAIAKLVTDTIGSDDIDLCSGPEICRTLADIAVQRKLTSRGKGRVRFAQPSLMSKLMWFVRPNKWAIYDGYVSKALQCSGGSATKKMIDFCKKLRERGFENHVASIEKTLSNNGFEDLFGTRVIDKFLWLAGAGDEKRSVTIGDCERFLKCLTKASRGELHKAAMDVASLHAKKLLQKV